MNGRFYWGIQARIGCGILLATLTYDGVSFLVDNRAWLEADEIDMSTVQCYSLFAKGGISRSLRSPSSDFILIQSLANRRTDQVKALNVVFPTIDRLTARSVDS